MNVTDVCDAAFVLSKSLALKLVLSAKCALCCVGMIGSMVVVMKGGLYWLGSPLTRAIFLGHLFSAFLCSSLFAFCYGFDVYRLSRVHEDPCDYTLTTPVAFWLRIIPVFGMFGSIYYMVSLAIERTFATAYPIKYGDLAYNKVLINIVMILVLLLSFAVPIGFLVPPVDWSKQMYIFNTRTDENTHMFQIMVPTEIVAEGLAIAVFHIIFYTNLRRPAVKNWSYLERRVQMESTKRVIHIMIPVIYTHLACLLLTTFGISLIPLVAGRHLTTTGWYISMECVNVIQIYPCFLSLVLLYKLHLRPLQLTKGQISTILGLQQKVVHIDELQKYFEEGEEYGKPKWYNGILCCFF